MDTDFGRYRAEEKIGQGAFGVVYRALDKNVQRSVALKVLTVKTTEDDFRRFEDEALTTSRLQHKNIVTVHDFGMQKGLPFIVMELLSGKTLLEEIELGKRSLLQKVEIMQQVAEGLQYAHGRQVIHRDIKPANIMVQQDGVVKIMDFGIARVIQEDVTRKTQAGAFMGTPAYTAPERFKGESDAKTDIFAFGVVFYELVTGSNPFAGGDYAEVAYRVRYVDPPPVGESVPGIPHALDHLISRSIDKDREVRYASLDAVLRDLRPIVQGLQQQRAEEMFNQLRPLLSANEEASSESLLERLNEVLVFFEHPEARRWHDRLEEEERRGRRAVKIAELRREGEDHLGAHRLREAVRSFENAARLDKDDVELKRLLETAQDALDRQTKAGRLYTEAVDLQQQEHYDEALEKLKAALFNDPDNRLAKRFHDSLLQQQREKQTHGILARADSLRRQQKFDEALQTLAELDGDDHFASHASALRAAIEQDRANEELREQERRLNLRIEEAQNDLKQGRLGEAGEKADVLSREFGPQTVVLELKENIAVQRRATTVAQALARAEDLFAKQMFAVAAVELHEALQKCRGDKKLEAALEFALAQKTAQEKAAAVRRTLSDCKMLVAAGKEADALATAKRAVEDFGREPALLDFIRQLGLEVEQRNQQLRQQQELRNLADSTLHTALELEGRQAYRPALETVQIALAKVQDDRLDEVCQRLQGKLRQQDEEARIRRQEDERRRTEQQEANNQRKIRHTATARAISEANGLVRQRNFQQACNVLEHCGEIYPDSPELKEAYQEVRREWEEFERTKQERIAAERLENQRKVRAAAIAKGLSAANAMLQGQEFQEACASLQQLTVTFPDAEEIRQAYKSAQHAWSAFEKDAEQRAERERIIEEGLKRATASEAIGDLDEPLRIFETLRAQFPNDLRLGRQYKELVARRSAIESERLAQIREEAIAAGRKKAADLLALEDFDSALQTLVTLKAQYPDSKEVLQDYGRALRLKKQRHGLPTNKRRWSYIAIAGAALLLLGGGYEAIKRTPTSPPSEAKQVAENPTSDSKTPSPEPPTQPVAKEEPLPSPAAEAASVSRSRLDFEFDGEKPPPQSVTVDGRKIFTPITDQRWLRVAKTSADTVQVELGNSVTSMKNGIYNGRVELQTQGLRPLEVQVQLQIERITSTKVEWSGTLHPHERLTIRGGSSSIGRLKRDLPKGIVSASVSGVDDSNQQIKTSRSLSQDTLVVVNEDASRNIENLTISIRSK